MPPVFRTVLRGYEPAQVDAEVETLQQALDTGRYELGEITVLYKEAQQQVADLKARVIEITTRAEEAARAKSLASRPTFADLGDRVGQILTLAEAEAADLLRAAGDDATKLIEDATRRAQAVAADADRYAVETRSSADADAEARLAGAQRRADEILDHADNEAAARREEGEAVYESQQARAAQAAADFERTLSDRRDAAAADFEVAMSQREGQLTAAEENLRASENEALRLVADAGSQAEAVRSAAKREAEELVSAARTKADRVRRDSERELAAVTARRDSITAQLANVRQMLATLGGGAMLSAVELDTAPTLSAPSAGEVAGDGPDGASEGDVDAQAQPADDAS